MQIQRRAFVVILGLAVAGCGNGGGGNEGEGLIAEADCFWLGVCPTPVEPGVPLVLREGAVSVGPLQDFRLVFSTFAGHLQIVVDWTHADSEVDVMLQESIRSGADWVWETRVSAPAPGPKPRQLEYEPPGDRQLALWIRNRASRGESFAYQVVLTPS